MFLQILLFIALYSITTHFLNKFQSHPPLPFPSLPIIGHFYLLVKKPIHRSLAKISKKHGPILLLHFGSRSVLLISSPSAAEECFTKNDIIFANRPLLLYGKHLGYNNTSLVWSLYDDNWRNLRRISSLQLLSTNCLQLLSTTRHDEVRLLVHKLFKNKEGMVDLRSALTQLTLNVMMRMIAGKRYYDDHVTDAEKASRFDDIIKETFLLAGASNMADYLPILKWVDKTEKRMIKLQQKREMFMQELVEEWRNRMKNGKDCLSTDKKKNMIEVLLSLQEQDPENYKDVTIRNLMMVLLMAGTDTSAGTMEWAMSFLLNHPEVLEKAQIEIDKVVGRDRLVEESDLATLPYLHCIIKETMRIKPVGPLLVPHESSQDCTIQGYHVPRGTMLLVNAWAIHNDPNNWEEPTKFKPDRFEGVEEGSKIAFKLMPFGSGRRGCPGESLATRVVGLTLGSLIQCFDWKKIGEEMVDMREGPGLTMPKAQPLQAMCRPRQPLVDLLSQI